MSPTSGVEDILRFAAALADPDRRAESVRNLAPLLGARDFIIFVRDTRVGRSLPAYGFPQTLRNARSWYALIEAAVRHGAATGTVSGRDGSDLSARAIGVNDGTVLVLLDLFDFERDLKVVEILLPVAGKFFGLEASTRRALAEAALARQSASEASELAAKLDMTRADLQRALSIAETATRARDEFLATVSHELRTPLTSIIGWIQLARQESSPEVHREALETIDRNARAQSRLIEDILDFSRINAGKLRLDVRPLELVDVIHAAVDIVRPAADAKGIRLDIVLDPNAGVVSGDPDRLQQVVWNLVSNAVKFTPRNGRVQIRLQRIESHSEITVSDTGEGISPEFLPHVFDRFSQADTTSTRSHGGLGLGLGIARHLIELHGGTIQVASPGRGQGATFKVHLPILVIRQEEPQQTRRVSAEERVEADYLSGLAGHSILIVEDNADARKLLSAVLERAGAAVETAESVASALAKLTKVRPDLIISDIEMPGEDGYSFIGKVRSAEGAYGRIPAIALTAYTRSIDRVRALAAGFQMHIPKPVEPAELVAAARSLLTTAHAPGPM